MIAAWYLCAGLWELVQVVDNRYTDYVIVRTSDGCLNEVLRRFVRPWG